MDPPTVSHITTYDLDSLPTKTFASSPPANPPLKQLRWWESPEVEYGEHMLTMTNTRDKAWIWFDYFEITIPQNAPSSFASITSGLIRTLQTHLQVYYH
ncbi:hypothetical protein BJ165DRAFT_877729 [Panaeolus papilionaceus]|nr:hypothetical protein BJ165DRAFT_877729 [Panaeolus papilionaceus]